MNQKDIDDDENNIVLSHGYVLLQLMFTNILKNYGLILKP